MFKAAKGASPRQLNQYELHLELRRADEIILSALQFIPTEQVDAFEQATIDSGLTQPDDFAAFNSRKRALNRINSLTDYLPTVAIGLLLLCLFLACCVYDLRQHSYSPLYLVQGGQHGSIN